MGTITPLYESEAELFVKTILIQGIEKGGAALCQKCPTGTISFD